MDRKKSAKVKSKSIQSSRSIDTMMKSEEKSYKMKEKSAPILEMASPSSAPSPSPVVAAPHAEVAPVAVVAPADAAPVVAPVVQDIVVVKRQEEEEAEVEDYTLIPGQLDSLFSEFDSDDALHATTISVGESWERWRYPDLLAPLQHHNLGTEDLKNERNKSFDLIDALSRSGSLRFDHATLHVVIASTHSFERTLINTCVMDNQNPIEKIERSTLILAKTIQGRKSEEMINSEYLGNVKEYSPALFDHVK